MKKISSLDRLAAQSVRQARNEIAGMQNALNGLRDGITGLARGYHAPHIRTPRHTIKGSRTQNGALFTDLAELFVNGLAADGDLPGGGARGGFSFAGLGASFSAAAKAGSGGYLSAAQSAGLQQDLLALAQRIR